MDLDGLRVISEDLGIKRDIKAFKVSGEDV